MESTARYHCAKCGHRRCEVAEMRTTGGFWSKIFNLQNRKFSTVTCAQCRYTELFQVESSKLGNVFDFFANG
jgi:predicted nucleic-acid-binding Zn-ribbon protein